MYKRKSPNARMYNIICVSKCNDMYLITSNHISHLITLLRTKKCHGIISIELLMLISCKGKEKQSGHCVFFAST